MQEQAKNEEAPTARQQWLAVLARATEAELAAAFDERGGIPPHKIIKPAETGTIMVEARAGGSGQRFNTGEATVTKCIVQIGASMGVSYALGRNHTKARLAAIVDALLQESITDAEPHQLLMAGFIAPAASAQSMQKDIASRKAAATKVEFFTMVRGE